MHLLNFREGFAANSSSTHSVWINNNYSKQIEESFEDTNFGWEKFVLTSREAILAYVAAQVSENLYCDSNEERKEIIDDIIGEEVFPDPYQYDPIFSIYVDHQSTWTIPRGKDSLYPSKDFVSMIMNRILDNNHIVTGGNDNGEEEDRCPIDDSGMNLDEFFLKITCLYLNGGFTDYYCVVDGDVCKIFDKTSGNKLTISPNSTSYDKSSEPELIDLIISNKCNFRCDYCYRNCTSDGLESDIPTIRSYIEAIKKMNTFEVAIGGGDILNYKSFDSLIDIIKEEKEKGDLVYNTTIKWDYSFFDLKNVYENPTDFEEKNEIFRRIKRLSEVFSEVAVSINSPDKAASFITAFHDFFLRRKCRISFQMIPELFWDAKNPNRSDSLFERLKEIVELSRIFRIPVTFLGFKSTGRGGNKESEIELVRNDSSFSERMKNILSEDSRNMINKIIRVDTQFLRNFSELSESLANWSIRTTEGTHSCCIDTTNNIISPSSYTFTDSVTLNPTLDSMELSKTIITAFSKF